jgi:hypothetical protein
MKPFQKQPEGPKDFPTKHIKLSSSEKPVFIKHLQNCNIEEPQRAEFECIVKSTPDIQIIWYKNGTPIQSSPQYITEFDINSGKCILIISQAFPEDSGQYTCIACSPGGEDSSTAWLTVKNKPEETVPIVPTKHQAHVSRKPKEVESNAPLRISSIGSSKTETELITATTTTTKTTRQSIQSRQLFDGKPEFFVPLNDADLIEGGQAVFQCAVQGKEPMKIQWFKQNKEIIPKYRYKASYDSDTGMCRLVISTLLEDDVGQYSCTATNEFGNDTTTANLAPRGNIQRYSQDSVIN